MEVINGKDKRVESDERKMGDELQNQRNGSKGTGGGGKSRIGVDELMEDEGRGWEIYKMVCVEGMLVDKKGEA